MGLLKCCDLRGWVVAVSAVFCVLSAGGVGFGIFEIVYAVTFRP
jgi:hypothetical protein